MQAVQAAGAERAGAVGSGMRPPLPGPQPRRRCGRRRMHFARPAPPAPPRLDQLAVAEGHSGWAQAAEAHTGCCPVEEHAVAVEAVAAPLACAGGDTMHVRPVRVRKLGGHKQNRKTECESCGTSAHGANRVCVCGARADCERGTLSRALVRENNGEARTGMRRQWWLSVLGAPRWNRHRHRRHWHGYPSRKGHRRRARREAALQRARHRHQRRLHEHKWLRASSLGTVRGEEGALLCRIKSSRSRSVAEHDTVI